MRLFIQLCSLMLSPGSILLIPSFVHVRQSKTAAQLVVRAPLTVHISHRYSGSLTGCPPTRELPGLACLRLNAVHLFHSCLSLVSYNCTLLPALFTPVAAPVPNHSHPVCARAAGSVHSLVAWASLCLGSPPLHGGNVPPVGIFFSSSLF